MNDPQQKVKATTLSINNNQCYLHSAYQHKMLSFVYNAYRVFLLLC
jgi:hypothetical protein